MTESILNKLGYACDTKMQQHISEWKEWYKGYVPSVHKYTTYNGHKNITHRRLTLNMCKRTCEDWASLLMNEKVDINTDSESVNAKLKAVLTDNDFYVQANRLIEKAFALGTGAFTESVDADGSPIIDYVTADMIFPLSFCGDDITECAFSSIKNIKGKEYRYINIHTKDADGFYEVQNRFFDEKGTEVSAEKLGINVRTVYGTGSKNRHFQIIRPNITNNVEEDTPLGISVCANAVAELAGADIIYDSYINEFKLGKKRIIVPETMTQRIKSENGVDTPLFDDNDTEFYSIPGVPDTEQKPIEINMAIRSSEHKESLQTVLNLLSDKCGLGSGRYSYERSGLKTATEVISENSDLYRNLKKHEIVLKSALISLVKALLEVMGEPEAAIKIDFDDSIIEDKTAQFQRDKELVAMGAMSAAEFRSRYLNEALETAQREIAKINEGYPLEE